MALPTDFPARVRAARAYAGIGSQSEFAKRIGRGEGTIKNWETGKHRPDEMAEAESVKRLAKASKLPEWFFTTQSLGSLRSATDVQADPRLDEIRESLRQLVGILTDNPDVKGDLFSEVLKTVERGMTRQAREALRPSPALAPERGRPPEAPSTAA